jgi:hypothetical protein
VLYTKKNNNLQECFEQGRNVLHSVRWAFAFTPAGVCTSSSAGRGRSAETGTGVGTGDDACTTADVSAGTCISTGSGSGGDTSAGTCTSCGGRDQGTDDDPSAPQPRFDRVRVEGVEGLQFSIGRNLKLQRFDESIDEMNSTTVAEGEVLRREGLVDT